MDYECIKKYLISLQTSNSYVKIKSISLDYLITSEIVCFLIFQMNEFLFLKNQNPSSMIWYLREYLDLSFIFSR